VTELSVDGVAVHGGGDGDDARTARGGAEPEADGRIEQGQASEIGSVPGRSNSVDDPEI
jgi:hypothetical protein